MSKSLVVHDPYRNIETTLSEFAKAEGVPRYTVSHYHWWHGSLEHFRERPPKGTGNGIKPHTYTRNGAFVSMQDARSISGMSGNTIKKYSQRYGTNDICEIVRRHKAEVEAKNLSNSHETDDGRKVSLSDFAKENGVSYNAVSMWARRHGSLRGFANRDYSRLNPKRYPHSGLGVSKTIREWAEIFGCKKSIVKSWLHKHGKDMNGFNGRKNVDTQRTPRRRSPHGNRQRHRGVGEEASSVVLPAQASQGMRRAR